MRSDSNVIHNDLKESEYQKKLSGEELTASEFLRSVSISESASIHGESFPTIRVFQSTQSKRYKLRKGNILTLR